MTDETPPAPTPATAGPAPAAPTGQDQRTKLRLLVVDDEESMRHFLGRGLRRHGHDVDIVGDGEQAIARWLARPYDAVILDLRLPGIDGLAVLSRLRSIDPDAVVLLMTAHGTIATAVEAMQAGAADFVTKPFPIEELLLRLDRAARHRRIATENQNLRALLHGGEAGPLLVGHSSAMRELLHRIGLLRASSSTVLLLGESGTGKSLVAKTLHLQSERAAEPFVVLHCPAVPETLVESELFGHEAGAFTGARGSKQGLIARAHRGTLFLDEIADMSLPAQAKIERFLQEREFLPLGAETPVRVDVRVIAASNRDLGAEVQRGRFRPELLWRLNVVALEVPPLRQRREDIPLLAANILRRLAEHGSSTAKALTAEAIGALVAYDWPGNVRQLENMLERMAVLAGERTVLGLGDLPQELRGSGPGDGAGDYETARRNFDRAYFTALLVRCGGTITEAARLAGLSRGHLHRRLRELQCDVQATRDVVPADGDGATPNGGRR